MRFNTLAGAAIAAVLAISTAPNLAFAGPGDKGHGHSDEHGAKGHGHGDEHAAMAEIGAPGKASEVTRTIEVSLKDSFYDPESINVKAGETIRFKIRNDGDLVHEFAIATAEMHIAHRPAMEMMVEHGILHADYIDHKAAKAMQKYMGHGMHDEPNSLLLEPGKSGEIVWKFPANGKLEFACNVPGHYEGGMVGEIKLQ